MAAILPVISPTWDFCAWDWATWTQVIEVVKDVVLGVCAIIGATVAVRGLATWRNSLAGTADFEQARRLYRAVLRTRDAISVVRNPFVSAPETAEALKTAGVPPEKMREAALNNEGSRHVYSARWKWIVDALAELRVEAISAEVLWGKAVAQELKPLYGCVSRLSWAINSHLRHAEMTKSGIEHHINPDKYEEIDVIMFEVSDDPARDKFTGEIQTAIEKVEVIVMKHLKL